MERTNSRIMHAKFECEGTSLNIINHHAPQSGTHISHKHRHWRTLEKMSQTISNKQCTIIVGDTNARLHGRMNETEHEIIGKHCFEVGRENICSLKDEELDNREELVDFCIKTYL